MSSHAAPFRAPLHRPDPTERDLYRLGEAQRLAVHQATDIAHHHRDAEDTEAAPDEETMMCTFRARGIPDHGRHRLRRRRRGNDSDHTAFQGRVPVRPLDDTVQVGGARRGGEDGVQVTVPTAVTVGAEVGRGAVSEAEAEAREDMDGDEDFWFPICFLSYSFLLQFFRPLARKSWVTVQHKLCESFTLDSGAFTPDTDDASIGTGEYAASFDITHGVRSC